MRLNPDIPTLSIYGIPDRNNLDFPEESHDHGLVLMDQGKVLKAIQLERLTGVKHDHRMPEYLYDILKDWGLLNASFDLVFSNNVLGSSLVTKNGKIRMEGLGSVPPQADLSSAHSWWIDRPRAAWLVNHELAHAFSALPFYPDNPDQALMVHFDGGASVSNFSAFTMQGDRIKLIEAHWDLKYLSAFFNANALVFGIIGAKKEEQLSVPGKMMGLAAYGSYRSELEDWLQQNDWFQHIWSKKSVFFDMAIRDFGWNGHGLSAKDPFCQDIVATFQEIFIRETIKRICSLQEKSGMKNLIFSGGSALNIVLNSRLVRNGSFDRTMIPPCCNDSGLALGAAVFAEWKKGHQIQYSSPFLMTCNDQKKPMPLSVIEEIACRIAGGEIVAVHNGDGEIGPRALGHRSIFCRADRKELAEKLSMQVKGREWYRPLAPVMRREQVFFFTGCEPQSELGLFMLEEFDILPEKRSAISGAVHVDGTARIQFLEREEDHPFLWSLLLELEHKHQIRCMINTSFNRRGKPIVHSLEQAKEQAKEMGIKVFFI